MLLGPYTLFDIVGQNEKAQFEISVISFEIGEPLNHTLTSTYDALKKRNIETCKEHNNEQVKSITKSIEEVKKLLDENPFSTKRKNQLEYLSNTLDHFVNWYGTNDFQLPQKLSLMEWSKGSFFANKDFSRINVDNNLYRLRRNQSKVVKLLFKNLTDELDGLSYYEMARVLDLTSTGKLSNYFKDSPRVGDVFNYSKRTGKYSLKH
jgi:organic radical activating enzyme